MQSIFFNIYRGMIIAATVVGISMFFISSIYNQYRLQSYIESLSQGIFTLISTNIEDKPLSAQRDWLAYMAGLSGLDIKMEPMDQLSLKTRNKILRLDKFVDKKLLVQANIDQRNAQVFYRLPDDSYVLSLKLHDVSEQLARGLGFLIKNELQQNDIYHEQPQLMIDKLQPLFSFKIGLQSTTDANLHFVQQNLLRMGNVVIIHQEIESKESPLLVFASTPNSVTPNSDNLLVFGPIEIFNWAPRGFIFLPVFFGILLFAICVYWLLRPLQKRLHRMDIELDNISLIDENESPMTVQGSDMLSGLAINVNIMVSRIRSLVKTQRELTQAISHELRSPIARIKFRLALLDEVVKDSDKKHLKGVESDVTELETLVDEILTLASLERDEPQMDFMDVAIIEELQQLLDGLSGQRPHINFTLLNPDNITLVYADAHYLIRACQNLIINAQRYAKSQVVVSIYNEPKHYSIRVQDDGIGISDTQKKGVFEPFTRLDGSRNRKSGGYGLGLAIVFQIMRWHRGNVLLLDSPMGGCEFRLNWLKL